MALHSKADFAKLCELTTGNLTNYLKRGKVIMSDNYIDDSIPQNIDFLRKRQSSKAEIKETLKDAIPQKISAKLENIEDSEIEDDEEDSVDYEASEDDNSGSIYTLQKKKLKVEIAKKERETAILCIKEDKLNGILIPTELVKTIFTQHSRSITTEFKNSIDSILTKISKKAGLNVNQIAELRGELLEDLNAAVNKSVDISKKNINNIVNEFSERKDVGERG